MDNFITYEYEAVIPSDLTSNNIIMLGRADDIYKRYDLGIQSMEFIIKEIPESKMKIISSLAETEYLQNLVYNLNMENYIEFIGFIINPEIYFKNSSLHIFPTLTEAFPMALSEIKIFGIPTILLGLDYVTLSEGGTIIIYDESPESIAKESLKIMKYKKYRFNIGKEARLSMKRFNNNLLAKKWIKLILSVYNGDTYYRALQNDSIQLSNITALKILNNQVKLIKKRKPIYLNTTIDDFLNFNYLMNFNFILDDFNDE
jgi:glycosyltransferase involved in cell wall biosynthesis